MRSRRFLGVGFLAMAAVLLAGLSPVATAQCRTTEKVKFATFDGAGDNRFGTYQDVDGDVMVLGAFLESAVDFESGAAYVYRKVGGTWIEEHKLVAPDGARWDHFGAAVAISGNVVAVAAPGDDAVPGGGWWEQDGAVYLFRYQGSAWVFEQKVISNDLAPDDKFGGSVALDGDALLAGAPLDDDLGFYSGSAYIFRDAGGTWTQEAKLLPLDGGEEDTFGVRVDLLDGLALVGAPKTATSFSKNGAAYLFEYTGSGWPQKQKLEASDKKVWDWFGTSVDLDEDVLIVGAPSFELKHYAAYIFRKSGGSFVFEKKLDNPTGQFNDFGIGVGIDGDKAVVGAPGEKHKGKYRAGKAYLSLYDGADWGHTREFVASDPQYQDQLGMAISMNGDQVLVGNEPAIFPGRPARAYLYDAHELAVYAKPKSAGVGEDVTLTVCGGMPGTGVLVGLVSIDGSPIQRFLGQGPFGLDEMFTISETVPAVLSGRTVEVQGIGTSFSGSLIPTNRETIVVR